MKKTIKGLFTIILAISLISCIGVMAFATEETAHALDHEHTHEGVPTCQGHWCDICEDFYGEPNLEMHSYAEPLTEEESALCDICGEPELAMVIFDPPAVTVWIEGFTRVILDFMQKFLLHLSEIFISTSSMVA